MKRIYTVATHVVPLLFLFSGLWASFHHEWGEASFNVLVAIYFRLSAIWEAK